MPSLSHRRGTRSQIDAAASANALRTGEVYLITDEARLTVGIAANAHQAAAKQGEGGGGGDAWTWTKLTSDVSNSSTALAPVTGLVFTVAANTTYLVEIIGAWQAAANTTGIGMALDIPSGEVFGLLLTPTTATNIGSSEQIADNATTGATTGVRVAATNTPMSARYVVAVGATGGTVQLQFRSEITASAVTIKAAVTAMGRRII